MFLLCYGFRHPSGKVVVVEGENKANPDLDSCRGIE